MAPQDGGKKKEKLQPDSTTPSVPSGSPYDSDSSIDPDSFVSEFVELQSKLYFLKPELFSRPKKGKKSSQDDNKELAGDPQIFKIKRKISKIESDVLFDRREAEYLWKEKLDALRKEAALFRPSKGGNVSSAPAANSEDLENTEETASQPEDNTLPSASGVDEDEDAGLLGGMFETETPILDAVLESKSNTAVTLRDFGKTVGVSPRRVLEETCKARYGWFS